jgi:quercetin dioxygenase-like cupin family protein
MNKQRKFARILAPLIALIVLVPASVADEPPKGPFSHVIPNIPGKSLIAVEVSYAPGQASPPHHHAKSAFIYVYVLSGQIASQVDDQPERIYKAGETFYETPGAHHVVSRNASQTEPAKMLAVFVVDTDDKTLTTPDK